MEIDIEVPIDASNEPRAALRRLRS